MPISPPPPPSAAMRWSPAPQLSALAKVLAGATLFAVGAGALSVAGGGWAIAGISLLIGLAAFLAGALLGFVFGMPRLLARTPGGPAADDPNTRTGNRLLESSAVLDKISEWLATMLVGIGLTQVLTIPGAVSEFYGFLAETGIGGNAILPFVGTTALILGLLCGFLFMYVYTRLVLTSLFQDVERALVLPEGEQQAVRTALRNIAASDSFAASQLLEKDSLSAEDAMSVMFKALYREPDGYKEVIELAGKLSRGPATLRPDYWFYLAAAFGQQYAAMKRANDQQGMASAEDNALDAARRSIAIDPSYRARLAGLAHANSSDDDLAELATGSEALRKLLGL